MLAVKDFENNFENILESMKNRGKSTEDLYIVKEKLKEKSKLVSELDNLRSERNRISNEHKGKIDNPEILEYIKTIKQRIEETEKQVLNVEEITNTILYNIPNILDTSVPYGSSENENVEILSWGIPRNFNFSVQSHDVLGKNLGILDIETGVKLSGSRFYTLKYYGAMLERAIAQYFLDMAFHAGYTEVFAPFIVKGETMFGTGQLPKFEEDLFKLEGEEKYLIPTAEVTLTSMYVGQILKEKELPMKFSSYSSCFRKEAGSYGKDTKGIFRVHQFQKVEMVHYAHPERSMEELEKMVQHAEFLLQQLELPYRKMLLCSMDTGFSAKKTYDLEVFLPSENRYREISSCSNCGDFQARRAGLKFKDENGKNQFIHTLNGSALAIGRTWITIIENYQNEDGSITIPKVLQKYMNGLTHIKKVDL